MINNEIIFGGEVMTAPTFSHDAYGEKFFEFKLSSARLSGRLDVLDCLVSEVLVNEINMGEKITVHGDIRTKNILIGEENRLVVYVFVNSVSEHNGRDINLVKIRGFICKEPFYRETPLGREVTNFIVASNRENCSKSDYIPCIAWRRNARRVDYMSIGTELIVSGRMQSREYRRWNVDGTVTNNTAYELSANRIEAIKEEE